MESPVISFTFDDFPRSALLNGGRILHDRGLAGTYYASLGLMGRTAPTGEIFKREDLEELIRQGHELGCHTFDHCDSWETAPAEFEASILRNRDAGSRAMITRIWARQSLLPDQLAASRNQTPRRYAISNVRAAGDRLSTPGLWT